MIVALAGGVGGAKMAEGLMHALPPGELTVIVNTADDFLLYGLRISPDIDTVLYTLGGIANPTTGWGIAGDTRNVLDAMPRLGEEPWFILGDQDLATHILRTVRLHRGEPLSEITSDFARSLGIPAQVIPVTNDSIATMVETPAGTLTFQDYFVRRQQKDDVTGIRFDGIESAMPAPGVMDAIKNADAIILCPSNPIVSIGPILNVPGIRDALLHTSAVRVAISPIIGGKALKGPADKMLRTLGHESSALGIARIYLEIIDAFIFDEQDAGLMPEISQLWPRSYTRQTIMGDRGDRTRFAREVLEIARSIEAAGAAW
jgi:LPPG:FO 2-phospho-L-lactate transferase